MNRKIVVLEPDPMLRLALSATLSAEPDLYVCGEAADAPTAWALLEEVRPGLLISSLSLPRLDGLAFIEQVVAQYPALYVLALGTAPEARCAERALRAGAHGYIDGHEALSEILEAVRCVLGGHYYVSTEVTDVLYEAVAHSEHPLFPSPDEVLSARELELFELLGCGLELHTIAERMQISEKTAESYRNRAKEKLHVDTAADVLFQATRWMQGHRICTCREGCTHILDHSTEETVA